MKDTNLTFQEIFNEPGLYVADSFTSGTCFKIDTHGFLLLVSYKDKCDLFPTESTVPVYKGLFDKTYSKVYTRQSLFNEK